MDHFYFVRHGETVWNVENKICGATDIELTQKGHEQASLAVQKANYAVKMYEKVGFEVVDENDEEFIMVCNL